METVELKVYIHAPVEDVWEKLSDYEGYADLSDVREAKLLRPGEKERNGLGAVRRVNVMGVVFIEDITAFDPPRRLEYHVKKCSIPLKHKLGRMDLTPRGEGTEIHWTTIIEIPIPIIGGLMTKISRLITRDTFYNVLLEMKEEMEAREGA